MILKWTTHSNEKGSHMANVSFQKKKLWTKLIFDTERVFRWIFHLFVRTSTVFNLAVRHLFLLLFQIESFDDITTNCTIHANERPLAKCFNADELIKRFSMNLKFLRFQPSHQWRFELMTFLYVNINTDRRNVYDLCVHSVVVVSKCIASSFNIFQLFLLSLTDYPY